MFRVQSCRVLRTGLSCSVCQPSLFIALLPLTPVSAVCLYPFTERCERTVGKENEKAMTGCPFIAGTPIGRVFRR